MGDDGLQRVFWGAFLGLAMTAIFGASAGARDVSDGIRSYESAPRFRAFAANRFGHWGLCAGERSSQKARRCAVQRCEASKFQGRVPCTVLFVGRSQRVESLAPFLETDLRWPVSIVVTAGDGAAPAAPVEGRLLYRVGQNSGAVETMDGQALCQFDIPEKRGSDLAMRLRGRCMEPAFQFDNWAAFEGVYETGDAAGSPAYGVELTSGSGATISVTPRR